ncbi:hypothetical protein SAMN05216227_101875 [Pseudorhodobacter antarcticus]|uniref:Mannitol repressor n=1 Tax=Pseudorhodobacter antarcticus TaxID=1077947 RepID=A0A1H8I0E9_9RHOB|nr:hypothetical protein [Pseudorhodobacter antarcticus]SEN61817.1 hypothetical protein SAMN05216227_101875 [Pseudorhodobacter antarcticus]
MLEADSEAIVKFAMGHRSYEIDKFDELVLKSPNWACAIAAHIHLDHVLDVFLEDFCVRPKAVRSGAKRMSSLDKATLLYGVGVLSEGSFASISNLNRLRNKFAHELNFDISDAKVDEYRGNLMSAYGDRVRSRTEYFEAVGGRIEFKLMLQLSVLFVEEERLAHLIHGLRFAQSQADLADAMLVARNTLLS